MRARRPPHPIASTGLLVAAVAALAIPPRTAHAYPWYVNTRYGLPALPASYTNFECTDCHVHPDGGAGCSLSNDPLTPCFNPFGILYRTYGWSTALGDGDADGDGLTNSYELDNPGSAGFPFRAEETGCDMLACASQPGVATACSNNVQCTATHGTTPTNNYAFTFACAPGANGVASGTATAWGCLYDDECLMAPCAAGAACNDPTTAQGDYVCTCPAGTSGDGRADGTGCTDPDECAPQPCGLYGTGGDDGHGCTRRPAGDTWTAPGYDCTCVDGAVSDGTTCVVDDECALAPAPCVDLATCADPSTASGDVTCTCPAGYQGDGRADGTGCTDVDECATDADDCGLYALCLNTDGGFTCTCDPGYTGDGHTCVLDGAGDGTGGAQHGGCAAGGPGGPAAAALVLAAVVGLRRRRRD